MLSANHIEPVTENMVVFDERSSWLIIVLISCSAEAARHAT